jgi:hypothetical protein
VADAEGPRARHVHVLLPGPPVHARGVPGGAAIGAQSGPRPSLDELLIADRPAQWAALGFAVGEDGGCDVGPIRLQLGAGDDEDGIVGWALRDVAPGPIDGLATMSSGAPRRTGAAGGGHANGAIGVDHVVVSTPDLGRTLGALEAAGLELRRTRDAGASTRQAFFVLGDAVLEVVGPAAPVTAGHALALGPLGEVRGGDPARFWGLTLVSADLARTVEAIGPERIGEPRGAVQPGRRIASVHRAAGLGTRLAFMTPR